MAPYTFSSQRLLELGLAENWRLRLGCMFGAQEQRQRLQLRPHSAIILFYSAAKSHPRLRPTTTLRRGERSECGPKRWHGSLNCIGTAGSIHLDGAAFPTSGRICDILSRIQSQDGKQNWCIESEAADFRMSPKSVF